MVTALAWSPTRPVLAVAGYSGLVQLWHVDGTPQLARSLTGLSAVPGAPEAIQALTFSPDGQLLAASDSSRTDTQGIVGANLGQYDLHFAALAIWRASNGNLVVPKDLGTGPGLSGALAFSRDGKLLAASRPDGSVLILDPTTGQVRQDASSVRRRRDGLAGVRPRRDPRDRHPGRDRPAVEPGQRRSSRGPGGRGRRPGHQHRVRPRRPAVRDHRQSGRNGQAVVQLNASARRHRAQHRAGRRRHRRVRARRHGACWPSTTTATASPGRPRSPPGNGAPARSPGAT